MCSMQMPYLLEEIVVDVSAHRVALEVEVDVHVLAEATRVVVSVRLRVSERLENAVRLQQNVLHSAPIKTKTNKLSYSRSFEGHHSTNNTRLSTSF